MQGRDVLADKCFGKINVLIQITDELQPPGFSMQIGGGGCHAPEQVSHAQMHFVDQL